MKIILAVCVAATFALICGTHVLVNDAKNIVAVYQEQLRGNLFVGLLTAAAFLLSLTTSIVIKLKERVYDHPEYIERHENNTDLGGERDRYAPLRRLTSFLSISIFSCIVAAVMQVTIGLVDAYWACMLALFGALLSVVFMFASMVIIRGSLVAYFDFIGQAQSGESHTTES